MKYKYQICMDLIREHQETSVLLERFKNFLRVHGISKQPDLTLHETKRILSDLKIAFEFAVPKHFAIEEQELFSIMDDAGYGELVEVLREDHEMILGLVEKVRAILTMAEEGSLTMVAWETLYRQGLTLVTELTAHAEKEDAGLLPVIEETIDNKQAEGIYERYLVLKAGKQVVDR